LENLIITQDSLIGLHIWIIKFKTTTKWQGIFKKICKFYLAFIYICSFLFCQ